MPDKPLFGATRSQPDWLSRQLECWLILDVRPYFAVANSGGGRSTPGIRDAREYAPGTPTDPYAT